MPTDYNQFPPVHPNCVCSINDGQWDLGESESGPCPICEMLAAQYNISGTLSKSAEKMIGLIHQSHKDQPWIGYKRMMVKSTLQQILPAERADISIISSDAVDLDGDIIEPDGMDFSDFKSIGSPVQLEHRSLQVGRALWIKKYDQGGLHGWIAKTQYHNTDKGNEAYGLVKSGKLSGKSIGGDWLQTRSPTTEEAEIGIRRVISKSKIYEFSICAMPVNPEAQVIAKSVKKEPKKEIKKAIEIDYKSEILRHVLKNFNLQDIIEVSRGRI